MTEGLGGKVPIKKHFLLDRVILDECVNVLKRFWKGDISDTFTEHY